MKLRSDVFTEIPNCKREVIASYSARFAALWTVVILLLGAVIGMPIYAANDLNVHKVQAGEVQTRNTEAVTTLKALATSQATTNAEIIKLLGEIKTEIGSIKTKIQIYHGEPNGGK